MKIIHSRLDGIPGDFVDPDAIQFASRKVAAVSGDARRALDICRRALELAEGELDNGQLSSRSRVTIATIKRAINEATTSPLQQHLRELPLLSKLLLAALLLRIRRSGLAESTLGDVTDEIYRMYAADSGGVDLCHPDGLQKVAGMAEHMAMGRGKAAYTIGLAAAALELMESGIILLEGHRAETRSKVRLTIGEDEVRMALQDDASVRMLRLEA